MNAQTAIAGAEEVEMSQDGLVTIPASIRQVAGLVPGSRLIIGINDRGEAVLLTRTQAKRLGESSEQRQQRIKRALDELSGAFSTGQSTDEIMEELRGPRSA